MEAGNVTNNKYFDLINERSDLKWTFRSQITKFIKRFWKEPYRAEDREWIDNFIKERNISIKEKFIELRKFLA